MATVSSPVAATLRHALRFTERRLAPGDTHVPGLILTLYREAAGVSQADLGRVMDVSKQRISLIEKNPAVTLETAARYRAAVDLCASDA